MQIQDTYLLGLMFLVYIELLSDFVYFLTISKLALDTSAVSLSGGRRCCHCPVPAVESFSAASMTRSHMMGQLGGWKTSKNGGEK